MMSIAENVPPPQLQRTSKGRRNARWAGFLHVLDVRMKELRREPEIIFWVFGFPILLALGLGIAFRNKPADVAPVVIVSGAGSQEALALIQGSRSQNSIHADVLDQPSAFRGFRLGKYALIIQPNGRGGYEYRYDPARPESVLARALVNESLQNAAGRRDPI